MAKQKTYYSCQSCGGKSPKWMGKCPDCGEWNTLVEEIEQDTPTGRWINKGVEKNIPLRLNEIENIDERRTNTGINEFDRVLGGGIVQGSLVLVGGDPGIGKSTILLQAAKALSEQKLPVMYITGEESEKQIRMRANRIGSTDGPVYILAETSIEEIIPQIESNNFSMVIIDSIQTMYTSLLSSAPGSISQVREVTARFLQFSKKHGVPVFLIGHVTKDGSIAGPRVLEHMVDTVLYFEGDRGHSYRILRAVKNRFGSANEIGVFEMGSNGLCEVLNPSELFISERPPEISGSAITAIMEGTRPLLVEIQALVSSTPFGMPRRNVIGMDSNRVSLLVAILEKRVGMKLQSEDIFINVAGGVGINEPGADLALICAISSSFRNTSVDPDTILLGEIGLSGEVRNIPQIDIRLGEASKLGFKKCILPKKRKGKYKKMKMELFEVTSVSEVLEILFKN